MASDEAKDRKKRVEEKRDTNNLITEKKDDVNIYEEKVFDVLEYLEKESKSGNNSVARKILKLKEYGITDEEIITRYNDKAGRRETVDSVDSILDSLFEDLVNYINEIPNGIYIDLATGEMDEAKSIEQALQYGINFEKSHMQNLDDALLNNLSEVIEKTDFEKVDYLLEKFKGIYIDSYLPTDFGKELDEFLGKDENNMILSDGLKEIVKNEKETIKKSNYESDPHLFEISKLQLLLRENSKGSQEYNIILGKIADFYQEHKEYVGKELPILNKDGSLNQNEIIKMQKFSETYQRLMILKHIEEFNSIDSLDVSTIDSNDKKHMVMCAFSGLKYENDLEYKEIATESMNMIKKLYPDLDLNNDQKLAEFFYEFTGIDANFSSLSKQDLIDIFSRQLKETTENYLEKNANVKVNEIDIKKLNWDKSERIIFDSAMRNFFVGSNINFTEKDEEEYNKMYRDVTIEAWIENKENAIKLRYDALITIREEYKNRPASKYTDRKLVEIERDIEEFERNFGKFDLTPKKDEVPFDVYREDFVKAGLTKYLTRDAREWSQGANYQELSNEHKKGYIRNILVALDDNKDSNSYMTKIALRRLELMGDDFVKINPDGTYKVNEELILEEYKKYSSYKYPSYEQLVESAKLRKNEYLLKKLEEYTKLPESRFVEIDRNDPDAAIAQIDEARYLSNQRRIEQFIKKVGDKKKEVVKKVENKKDEVVQKVGDKKKEVVKKVGEKKKEVVQKVGEKKKKIISKVGNKKISDKDLFESVKGGILDVEVINTSATKINTTPQVPRDDTRKNQEEQNGGNGETSAVSEMKAEIIDATAISNETIQENNKPSFIENIKNIVARAKKAISRIMKNDEETLMLDAAKDDISTSGNATVNENKKVGYDINKQYDINHNLVNSGEKIQRGQEIEGGEREN